MSAFDIYITVALKKGDFCNNQTFDKMKFSVIKLEKEKNFKKFFIF